MRANQSFHLISILPSGEVHRRREIDEIEPAKSMRLSFPIELVFSETEMTSTPWLLLDASLRPVCATFLLCVPRHKTPFMIAANSPIKQPLFTVLLRVGLPTLLTSLRFAKLLKNGGFCVEQDDEIDLTSFKSIENSIEPFFPDLISDGWKPRRRSLWIRSWSFWMWTASCSIQDSSL